MQPHYPIHPFKKVRRFLLPLLLAALWLTGCHVTPYRRNLPEWVRRVYVPMAVNKTYEPGLEESITNALAMEIAADGRLEVTTKSKCDAVIKVTLRNYTEETADFENDDVESRRRITLIAEAALYEPDDPKTPFAQTKRLTITSIFESNYRSTRTVMDVDAREQFAQMTGLRILHAIMNQIEIVQK